MTYFWPFVFGLFVAILGVGVIAWASGRPHERGVRSYCKAQDRWYLSDVAQRCQMHLETRDDHEEQQLQDGDKRIFTDIATQAVRDCYTQRERVKALNR